MPAQSYPLQWPDYIPRSRERGKSGFKASLAAALNNVRTSLTAFGRDSQKPVTDIVLSSNVSLGVDNPADPGVAVWFVWEGQSLCFPVDRYRTPAENLQAIYHIIEARRTELRHGTLHLVRATMTGFKALPPPPGAKAKRPWWDVLQLEVTASRDDIERRFRELSKKRHPDTGGSTEAFAELNQARQEALA